MCHYDLMYFFVVVQSRKSSSFKAHKNGERGGSEDVDVKNVQDGQTKLER